MKPSPREFALLKLLAVSASHILDPDRARLRFIAPYIVKYVQGQPAKLWLPDLDNLFKCFVDDPEGDAEHNRKLWEMFHNQGRPKNDNVSIWKYINNHLKKRSAQRADDVEVEREEIPLSGKSEFIISKDKNGAEKYTVLVATAYQSCGTLIAVISFATKKNATFSDDDCKRLKTFLEQVRQGQYLNFLADLHIPNIGVQSWRAMRETPKANHWGDNQTHYVEFWGSRAQWAIELSRDFSEEYESSAKPGDHGRPTIQEVLTVDTSRVNLGDVIKRRIVAILGDGDGHAGFDINIGSMQRDSKAWRYMWFNAIAVADSIAAAIRSYRAIVKKEDHDRLWIDEIHRPLVDKVNCILSAKENINIPDQLVLCVRVFEPGLVGEWKQVRGGNEFNAIYMPAIVAGASAVQVTYVTKDGEKKTVRINKSVRSDWVVCESDCMECRENVLFTGICYRIVGKWNKTRGAWVVEQVIE